MTVIALDDAFSQEDRTLYGDTPLLTARVRGPRFFGFAPGLRGVLLSADADILHLHGIWMYPSHAGSRWARRTRRPYMC